MKFIVDEFPIYHQECPFYNVYAGECRLGGEEWDPCGNPEAECPHLKALESKCDICLEYTPMDMIRPEHGSFEQNRRKLVGGYCNE